MIFLPQVFNICQEYGHPLIDMFTTRANTKLPLNLSPNPDAMTWKAEAFWFHWDYINGHAFQQFAPLRQFTLRVMFLQNLFDPGSSTLPKEKFADLLLAQGSVLLLMLFLLFINHTSPSDVLSFADESNLASTASLPPMLIFSLDLPCLQLLIQISRAFPSGEPIIQLNLTQLLTHYSS